MQSDDRVPLTPLADLVEMLDRQGVPMKVIIDAVAAAEMHALNRFRRTTKGRRQNGGDDE